MRNKHSWKHIIRNIVKNRAAYMIAAAVSVFLCALTLFEFAALELEIEVPVLEAMAGGADKIWMEGYREEEMALDVSTENEILGAREECSAGKTQIGAGELDEEDDSKSPELSGIEQGETENSQGEPEDSEKETENLRVEKESTQEAEAQFPYYIRVNRKQNCITVYSMDNEGEYTIPYRAMICSTGLYNATPRGTFHLSTKYLWRELYGGVYGQYASRITGGVLFHSVPYYKKNKNTLCTDKYNKLGQQASMGCIRLTVEDALWITENCPSGTAVEIYDDDNPGPLGKPEAAKIDTDSPNKGWDPTDPDEENPWHEPSENES